MKKDVTYYLSSNIIRMVVSIIVILPLITFYLSVEEVGVFGYMMLLASMIMIPLNSGGGLVIGAYFFHLSDRKRKELFFHIYLFELLLKCFSLIITILIAKHILIYFIEDYKEEYLNLFYLLSFSLLFSSTKAFLYQKFTLSKESQKFFIYNVIDLLLMLIVLIVCLYGYNLGLLGYALATFISAILMFFVDFYVMKNYMIFSYKKRWFKIIYKKGIRLFYANFVENFFNFYDSFIIQKSLSFYSLGLYLHAKQYLSKFNALEKSFYQSYSVEYMLGLKKIKQFNNIKVSFLWYVFLLFVGIFIIFFSKDLIALLTHDKFTESSYMLKYMYLIVFLRFNQVQFNQQILFNKQTSVFVNISVAVNIFIMLILTVGMLVFKQGIDYVLFTFVLGFLLKNIITKIYAILKYKIYDKSEWLHWISLLIYIITWRIS